MSDEDDYDDSEEEEDEDDEDEDDDDDDEDGDGDEEDEEALKAAKQESVQKDIDILLDVTLYIDRVKERMKRRLVRDYEDRLEEEEAAERLRRGGGRRRADDDFGEADGAEFDPPIWENYEGMDEAERAALLERAIMVLGEDRSEGEPKLPSAPGEGGIRTSRTRMSARKYW